MTRRHASALRDSATMLRRNLKHMVRYPSMSLLVVGIPVVLLLLFVYVFGGTMGAGLGVASGGRAEYLAYVTPGILLLAVAGVAQGTAISVSMDMAEGIIARFRTMGISRGAVLAGHVLGNTLQTLLGLVAVIGVALAIGFRPDAGPVEWLAAIGLLAIVTLAVTWLSAAFGLKARSVETASNLVMPLMLLLFLGSGFAPIESMPVGMRWFAEHQPFTPVTETLRGLLMGTAIGHDAAFAVGWCVLIGVAGYRWAMRLYDRDPTRHVQLLSAGRA
ncbi:MAG TPA: ABC transporter permease [Actinomycetota bacterium]|nr:ABC transporter permease [Actinomycetota bacterium]